MQAALVVILGGMLALAALVREHQFAQRRVELGLAEPVGEWAFRRPAGWTVLQRTGSIVFEEPARPEGGRRTLVVSASRAGGFVSPLEHLARADPSLNIHRALGRDEPLPPAGTTASGIRPATVAGWPGIVVWRVRTLRAIGAPQPLPVKLVVACAVLPDGEAIVVRLEGNGSVEPADLDLVERLAKSLSRHHQPMPQAARQLDLRSAICLDVPSPLLASAESDHLRIGQLLLADPASDQLGSIAWLGVEVVPLLLLDEPGPEALLELMLLRDPQVRIAVEPLDEQTWHGVRTDAGEFPVMVYLHRNQDGRAVLVEVRWAAAALDVSAGAQQASALWETLRGSIDFGAAVDLAPLVERGVAAVASLPADPVELVGDEATTRMWQWFHESAPGNAWTIAQHGADADRIVGWQQTDVRPGFIALWSPPPESSEWQLSRNWKNYGHVLTRAAGGMRLRQRTDVVNGVIQSRVFEGNTLRLSRGGPQPPTFIPGPLLPAMLGRLPFEPMVIQTDVFPTAEGARMTGLLTLVLEPSFQSPRYMPEQPDAMRRWLIGINGASEASVWYLDHDGRLNSIAFAGGIHVQRGGDAEE